MSEHKIARMILAAVLALPVLASDHPALTPACKSCGKHVFGTSIAWAASPTEAAKQATQEEKLVFVLHVSGHFEDPAVT